MSDEKKELIKDDSQSFLEALSWEGKPIFQQKYARFVDEHFDGERSGKEFGIA